ncbi:FAD-dependent monooxygenase [Allokutzneria sp. A3M-2-11 16]|uniref:FAD-dependent monooxygenase n=1 Tax=Allokutzneria sp. A3M-2-11 16 TaxID=2962043 RepID=UPI0020B65E73|nr:FAD-dependent monooxygenase [Allokutzneria sp. A3M-2-11 16]MCP3804941.1 FAD-dependent monooxygenase [Allokutzneria sp. A3M-2-11 16]
MSVLIVGAGPVGLTLALGLHRLGVPVRVVERETEEKRQPRACVLWPRAIEALEDVGLAEIVTAAALPIVDAQVFFGGERAGVMRLGAVESRHPHPLSIEQHELEALLAGRLAEAGIGVDWRHEVLGVEDRGGSARTTLRLPDGEVEEVDSDWVVGCEGTRSVVRESAGIAFVGHRRRNLQALQVNAHVDWPFPDEPGRARFFLDPEVSLGVFPIPGGGYRFFAFTTDPDPSRTDPPTVAEMRDLVAKVTRVPDLRLKPTEPIWLNRARFADRIATRLRSGRLLLAGDSAHAWAPIGGHGMNTGIRGAHNLAWKLASVHKGQTDQLLDHYDREQRAAAREVMVDMRFNVLEIPLPRRRYEIVRRLLPIALSSKRFVRALDGALSDLGKNNRLPDRVVRVGGSDVRAHELLSYDRWTLLVELPHAVPAPAGVTVVGVEDLTPLLGRRGLMCLVRPDRHIAWVCRATA